MTTTRTTHHATDAHPVHAVTPDDDAAHPTDAPNDAAADPSTPTQPRSHLMHLGKDSVTAPVLAGQGPASGAGLGPVRDGVGGCLTGLPAPGGTDGEDQRWAVFLACWRDRFGGVSLRAVEVMADAAVTRDRLTGRSVDPWDGGFITGPDGVRAGPARKLGRLLAGQVDRWHGDPAIRLRAAQDTHDRATRYWVEETPRTARDGRPGACQGGRPHGGGGVPVTREDVNEVDLVDRLLGDLTRACGGYPGPTPAGWAYLAAQAVRGLNHASLGGDGYPYPGDVDAVVEASGWYPNRPRRSRAGQHPGGRGVDQLAGAGEACAGRVYLHTHPVTVP